jgi:hypothetical protein
LKDWIEYYNIPTYIDELIDCVSLMNDDKGKPIFLNDKKIIVSVNIVVDLNPTIKII